MIKKMILIFLFTQSVCFSMTWDPEILQEIFKIADSVVTQTDTNTLIIGLGRTPRWITEVIQYQSDRLLFPDLKRDVVHIFMSDVKRVVDSRLSLPRGAKGIGVLPSPEQTQYFLTYLSEELQLRERFRKNKDLKLALLDFSGSGQSVIWFKEVLLTLADLEGVSLTGRLKFLRLTCHLMDPQIDEELPEDKILLTFKTWRELDFGSDQGRSLGFKYPPSLWNSSYDRTQQEIPGYAKLLKEALHAQLDQKLLKNDHTYVLRLESVKQAMITKDWDYLERLAQESSYHPGWVSLAAEFASSREIFNFVLKLPHRDLNEIDVDLRTPLGIALRRLNGVPWMYKSLLTAGASPHLRHGRGKVLPRQIAVEMGDQDSYEAIGSFQGEIDLEELGKYFCQHFERVFQDDVKTDFMMDLMKLDFDKDCSRFGRSSFLRRAVALNKVALLKKLLKLDFIQKELNKIEGCPRRTVLDLARSIRNKEVIQLLILQGARSTKIIHHADGTPETVLDHDQET